MATPNAHAPLVVLASLRFVGVYLKETGRQLSDFGFDVISDLSQTAAFRPTLFQFQTCFFQSLFQLCISCQLDLQKNEITTTN